MSNSELVLIFDTETTGLFSKNERMEEQPYIIQFSFVVFDLKTMKTVKTFDEYIKIDSSVEIKPQITNITGITKEMCENKGISIETAISAFFEAYISCRYLVAHNLNFDKKMISIELKRNIHKIYEENPDIFMLFNEVFNHMNGIKEFCTMNEGKHICNILIEKKTEKMPKKEEPKQFKKCPKLTELHEHLFGYKPENLHNSLVDTMVCMKCFLKIKYDHVSVDV